MAKSCIIIGGGIAGTVSALSLAKIGIECTIFELRGAPSTIGGAVNLTPNALRLLEDLDVEVSGCRVDAIELFSLSTGRLIGEMPFRKFGPSLRILREDLLRSLLSAVEEKGVSVVYGRKLVDIKDIEQNPKVVAIFEGGKEVQADFILGCDGVHSAVRTLYVEPSRVSTYTGVSAAYSMVDAKGLELHFQQTGMASGRLGSLLTSYVDPDRTRVYIGAVMSTPEENDKQGWRARGSDRQKTMEEIERRYTGSAIPCLDQLFERVDDFVFYPVYNLGPGGIWSRGRVHLLGDAAHCMPPQGESTGLAIEDGVLIARVLSLCSGKPIQEAFQAYDKTRRPRIDKAYQDAAYRWSNVKDKSWLAQWFIESLTWIFLWYKRSAYEASMSYDVRQEKIVE